MFLTTSWLHPLYQFEIMNLISCCSNVIITTNLSLFCIVIICIIIVGCNWAGRTKKINRSIVAVYWLFDLVNTILKQNFALYKQVYFTNFVFLFLFILISNFVGLIPFTFTLTSSLLITFTLALLHYLTLNLLGFYMFGWKIWKLFWPSGVPVTIMPLLLVIEFVSYLAKVFSLSIRLFANMMSGHALLKILISFVFILITYEIQIIFVPIPWVIISVIYCLEVLIAFLQAYVFTVLIAIYFNDALYHH